MYDSISIMKPDIKDEVGFSLIIRLYRAKDFAIVLKIMREFKGLSKVELSELSQIDRTVLSKLETGNIKESDTYLRKLEHAFSIPREFLITFTRDPFKMSEKIRDRYKKTLIHIFSLFILDQELDPGDEDLIFSILK